jgi:8-amino-7-oxononanoate synthase
VKRWDTRPDSFAWVDDSIRRLRRAGLHRELPEPLPEPLPERELIDLSGNDYAHLARHPLVVQAVMDAATEFGAGATGARLVSGDRPVHRRLESELATFTGVAAALVFSSAYLANLGIVTAMCRPGSLVVLDAHAHASLLDGCKLAGADIALSDHGSVSSVAKILADSPHPRILVITESVFSVDGDLAPLEDLYQECRKRGAGLLVDDAHGLGVLGDGGRGALHATGLAGAPDVVATSSLGKSLGSQGGVLLGPDRVIRHAVGSSRSFLFNTALAPTSAAAALASVRVLTREPERAEQARAVAQALAQTLATQGLPVSSPAAAVFSVRAPSASSAVAWARKCRSDGVLVGCFRPPSVPDGHSRLRLGVHPALDTKQRARAADVITRHSPWQDALRPPL